MLKFVEWLVGYHHGLEGAGVALGSPAYIDGYSYGYEKGEKDSGLYN